MTPRKTLAAKDWIDAAFVALGRGGVQAIRAEALARELKVSKGSFYWHFKDVPALRAQMLRHWSEQATARIINAIDAHIVSPRQRLRLLLTHIADGEAGRYGGKDVDAAIRDWARHDAAARETLETVDARRLDYVAALLRSCGIDANVSEIQARLLYGALIGTRQLATTSASTLREELLVLLEALLSQGVAPGKR
ncbi:MAG: transcriptional regulator [Solidesulfovibrio magneticus str. Maddingley MBC34]|uniref:Transcriptional regulator n=1 Tax=Solidesulfovibrio magneticus str. Maddingley MBC34 TaxID=1206767 RepID=K6GDG8_9BACT|nr:MAG: transcriptional regulator [Solidesulfovibrio magneticus str. Maddingley MBC34]